MSWLRTAWSLMWCLAARALPDYMRRRWLLPPSDLTALNLPVPISRQVATPGTPCQRWRNVWRNARSTAEAYGVTYPNDAHVCRLAHELETRYQALFGSGDLCDAVGTGGRVGG